MGNSCRKILIAICSVIQAALSFTDNQIVVLDFELVHHFFKPFRQAGQLLGTEVDLAAAGGHFIHEHAHAGDVAGNFGGNCKSFDSRFR